MIAIELAYFSEQSGTIMFDSGSKFNFLYVFCRAGGWWPRGRLALLWYASAIKARGSLIRKSTGLCFDRACPDHRSHCFLPALRDKQTNRWNALLCSDIVIRRSLASYLLAWRLEAKISLNYPALMWNKIEMCTLDALSRFWNYVHTRDGDNDS